MIDVRGLLLYSTGEQMTTYIGAVRVLLSVFLYVPRASLVLIGYHFRCI